MLNFNRNGTGASGGVSQMTMPSRYRSLMVCGGAVDAVWPQAAVANSVTVHASATATLAALHPNPRRGITLDQQSVTERARPASLVSLYLLFMSLAVCASARSEERRVGKEASARWPP